MTNPITEPHPSPATLHVDCCVAGAGSAGLMVALLLARKGVRVHVLEAHHNLDLPFRGDVILPGVLEILDSIGLAEPLLAHSSARSSRVAIQAGEHEITLADFTRLEGQFPFAAMIPQTKLLELLAATAGKARGFALTMGADVAELVREDGRVVGARAAGLEVRAPLTVACDGRSSRLRALAGLAPRPCSPPVDVVWFRLPRAAGDPDGACVRAGMGRMLVQYDRGDDWEFGLVLPKGTASRLRDRGAPALVEAATAVAPDLADRLGALGDWRGIETLTIEPGRLKTWHRPGLLCLGDAAHPMSLVGSVAANYAVQDAVEAANVLADPLRCGGVATAHLIEIQRRRDQPTRMIQFLQARLQARMIGESLAARPFRRPWFFNLPGFTALSTRLIAFGPWRTRVE